MDRFEQMRVFASVVEAGGFTRAMPRAGMSRAAVSKHVLQLEERLGVRLLNRTTRQVGMTEAGRIFYEQCRRILDEVASAEQGAAQISGEPHGELRVVAPTNFALTYLGDAITEFLLAYHDLKIDLSLNDRAVDPIDGGYDLAIRVINSALPDSASLAATRLTTSSRILCASPAYLLEHGTPRQPQELSKHQCLSYSYVDDPRSWRLKGKGQEKGKEHVVSVSGRIITSAGQVLSTAAAAGLGIAYGPTVFFQDAIARGKVVQVLPDYDLPQVSIYAIYPVSRHRSPKVTAFTGFMQKFFAGKL
ncbi:LysR family transcriptional regulator [Roseiarcaceae bacterium H3SJ34-1]|uniref:LysR family transcriptional regulator n=1 Tax=Terripilifer ovatus TaxID=3032367 RepID=UPI003AB932EE|nr:LysR family transcriptional regulator [Roseiarcaceae bacterium H3SJ34-1]